MASIVLVHPLFLAADADEQAAASPYFPLGLLYLASYLRERGHEVAIYDATFEPDASTFRSLLREGSFDVAGFSALMTTRDTAVRLADMAVEYGATVVFGGPDPTLDPAWYLAHEAVDVVVHHEGEQTIAELLDQIDAAGLNLDALTNMQGIAFRRDGKVTVNQPRPPIENLDELPRPARDLIDMDRYLHQWQQDSGYTSITISTARGCPYGCEWCADAVHGSEWRQRSPESVAAEMADLKQTWGVDSIRIVDDVDGFQDSWLDELATVATASPGAVPFEALHRLKRDDLPLLEVRDSL